MECMDEYHREMFDKSIPDKEKIDETIERYSFRIPYGDVETHNKEAGDHFSRGVYWTIKFVTGEFY